MADRRKLPGSPGVPGERAPRQERAFRLVGRVVALIPVALLLLAEAAWIWVLAGLVQEFTLHDRGLELVILVAAVAAGLVAARLLVPRLGARWPVAALLLIVVAGAAGWLSSPQVRDLLATGGLPAIGPALGELPAGWLAGLALLRGFALARPDLDPRPVGRLLGVGAPGLVGAVVLGGMVAEPWRARFLADAQLGTVLFLICGLVALALARLGEIGLGWGFDWRRNPAWVGFVIVLVLGIAFVALPVPLVSGPAIRLLIGLLVVPALIAGLVVGYWRQTVRTIGLAVIAVAVVLAILRLFAGSGTKPPPDAQAGGGAAGSAATTPTEVAVVLAGAGIVVVIVVILVLAWLWMRRVRPLEDPLEETRVIDRGEDQPGAGPAGWRRLLPRIRSQPRDAIGAYLALLEALERRPAVRRNQSETPAEHAHRLRAAGRSGLSLDLLAADYALARFGGAALTLREERRAVLRGRRLGRLLTRETGDGTSPRRRG